MKNRPNYARLDRRGPTVTVQLSAEVLQELDGRKSSWQTRSDIIRHAINDWLASKRPPAAKVPASKTTSQARRKT